MAKRPKLLCSTGQRARHLRASLGLSQGEFWSCLDVTQSGGSRYESGRGVPIQALYLLHLVYGTEQQAQALLASLRRRCEQKERPARRTPRGVGGGLSQVSVVPGRRIRVAAEKGIRRGGVSR